MRRNTAVILFSTVAIILLLASSLVIAGHYFGSNSRTSALVSSNEVIITNFQAGHGFVRQSAPGEQLDDTLDFAIGSQSLKLVTYGDGSAVFTRKSDILPALNFTDRVLKLWIKVNGTDNIRELRITITNDDFRTYTDYWISGALGASAEYLRDNQWNIVTLSPGHASPVGAPDISSVDTVQVRVSDKGLGKPAAVWINSLSLVARNDRPIVTFSFDDGYETDYTNARPILDRYHFPATSYIVASLVGGEGRLGADQLTNLQDLNGWDIASHSYNHRNLTSLSPPEIEDELSLSKQFLVNNGFFTGSDHFAYPYGEFDSESLRYLVQKSFKTARTSDGEGETLPPSDPHRLRIMLITNTTSPAQVSERVQSAIANGDWLILVFHRIVESNANHEMTYLRADFEAIVDDVASRGVDVMTVAEVYESKFR